MGQGGAGTHPWGIWAGVGATNDRVQGRLKVKKMA